MPFNKPLTKNAAGFIIPVETPHSITLACLRDLLNDGVPENKLEEILIRTNQNLNDSPLADEEVRKIIFKELKERGRSNFIDAAPFKLELDSGVLSYVSSSPRRQFLFGHDVIPMNMGCQRAVPQGQVIQRTSMMLWVCHKVAQFSRVIQLSTTISTVCLWVVRQPHYLRLQR